MMSLPYMVVSQAAVSHLHFSGETSSAPAPSEPGATRNISSAPHCEDLGPVVQSIVSLTMS